MASQLGCIWWQNLVICHYHHLGWILGEAILWATSLGIFEGGFHWFQ